MQSSSQSLNDKGVGLSDTDYSSFQVFIPNSLRFNPTKKGLAARRVPFKLRSEQQTYATNNNKLIRFILPNNAIYDTRNGYITFTVNLSVTGGTYSRIHQGIFSIMNRLRILAASTEVEDLRDYNRIYSMLWEMKNPQLVTANIGTNVMGFGTQAQRNALSPQSDYAMPVMSGILNNELLPLDNLQSGLVLEFYLEDPSVCVETDGTNPVITISNLVFHYERLELDNEYRSFIRSYINSNGLQIGFHTWERLINALTTGQSQNLMINHRSSSMNGILNVLVDSSQTNVTTINDKFLNWPPLSMTQTNVIINGSIFPDEPIDTVFANRYEPYHAYCRWVQKTKLNGIIPISPSIDSASFAVDRFVQIDDFEAYPEVSDIVNPFTTLANNSTIIKKLVFSAVVPANYQLDSWVEYFRQIAITVNGSIRVLQ